MRKHFRVLLALAAVIAGAAIVANASVAHATGSVKIGDKGIVSAEEGYTGVAQGKQGLIVCSYAMNEADDGLAIDARTKTGIIHGGGALDQAATAGKSGTIDSTIGRQGTIQPEKEVRAIAGVPAGGAAMLAMERSLGPKSDMSTTPTGDDIGSSGGGGATLARSWPGTDHTNTGAHFALLETTGGGAG